MSKRLLLSGALAASFALVPLAGYADDMPVPSDAPAPAATDTTAPTTSQVQPDGAGAAGLGPATTQPGSSTSDSSSLQGASTSPLQSTTSDSTGLTAPANALQAPATADQTLRVIMGESDGEPKHLAESAGSQWAWLAFTVLFAGILVVGYMFLRRYGGVRIPLPNLRLPQLRLPRRRTH